MFSKTLTTSLALSRNENEILERGGTKTLLQIQKFGIKRANLNLFISLKKFSIFSSLKNVFKLNAEKLKVRKMGGGGSEEGRKQLK